MFKGGALGEYLVKIGWDLNQTDMNRVQETVVSTFNKFDDLITDLKKTWVGSLFTIASALGALSKYSWNFLKVQAKIDLENRNMAKQYMVSANAMMAYNNALSELNISYEDLYYATDEVKERFNELVLLGRETEAPQGLEDTLKLVRDISFQFQRFNIILQNGKRWIAYYIGQFAGPELRKVREGVTYVVDKVKNNIQPIAKGLGWLLSLTFKIGSVLVKLLSPVLVFVRKLLELGAELVKLLSRVFSYLDWTTLSSSMDKLFNTLSSITDEIKRLLDTLGINVDVEHPLVKFFQTIIDLASYFLDMVNEIIMALDLLASFVTADFDGLNEKWNKMMNTEVSPRPEVMDAVTNPMQWLGGKIASLFGDAIISPFTSPGNNISNQNQKNTFNLTYNVNSASEAKSLQQQNLQDLIDSVSHFRSPIGG